MLFMNLCLQQCQFYFSFILKFEYITNNFQTEESELLVPGYMLLECFTVYDWSVTYLPHTSDKGQGHIRALPGNRDTVWCYTGPYTDTQGTCSHLETNKS